MRAYRPFLAEMDLTYPQYLVMISLWQHGAAPVDAIASRLKVGVDAIEALIEQLERSGYIHRVRASTDRRTVTIVLSQTGVQLEEAATEAQRQVRCQTGLTERGMASLRSQLHGLIDRITVGAITTDEAGC